MMRCPAPLISPFPPQCGGKRYGSVVPLWRIVVSDAIQEFYDGMAESYHLLFRNWEESIARQASVLDGMLAASGVPPGASVLDCACGIGTQALGLAARGYHVAASDISGGEIERARREAARMGFAVDFAVADFRRLDEAFSRRFDAVIAMDNAFPHLIDPDDMRLACESVHSRLADGGAFMASIRDYDEALENKPTSPAPAVISTEFGRRIAFQVWDWRGDVYDFTQYIIVDEGDAPQLRKYSSRYRAVTRSEFTGRLAGAGFVDIAWCMPAETGYYQPIVVARRP